MIAAIEAVKNGQGVTAAAAKLHNVPKSTLNDRMYSGHAPNLDLDLI